MTEFNKVRTNYNDLITPRGEDRVSVTALLVKLLARTLEDHPLLNSTLQDEVILLHEEINIGLVVALENGLIVPVLKNANQKGIGEIAEESNDLITRARKGKLTSKDIKGATFSISNLGPFGVEQFTAIINPPEVAVLAVGAILPTVVPVDGDKIEVRPFMRFTLSADHRVLDGVIAARFITDLKTRIENPKLENY
jgi:pyruvate dehydrogenase E2 component (dihydrolipoamide acetyltransferase)